MTVRSATAITATAITTPSALDPHGPGAASAATVWWILLALATLVFVVVMALIVVALLRRGDGPTDTATTATGGGRPPTTIAAGQRIAGLTEPAFLAIGGVLVPFVILAGVGVITVQAMADQRATPVDPLRVEVEGADWFWNVRYPDHDLVTANEVHVPVGRPVELTLTTRDVIHSFWVPQLASKTDMIPGQPNRMHLTAERAGVYRGQCAEFCGLQHANMAFVVIAEEPAAFEEWVARTRRPAAPEPGPAADGRAVFERSSCAGCHTIRGTTASGTAGPDLSDVGGRLLLGAGTVEHTPENLRRFITRAQEIKPGNAMPNIDLPPEELDALVTYLEGLR